jgi:hypothetical protein
MPHPAVAIERHPRGPRLYVRGLRVHHGLSGALVCLAALAGGRRPAALLGLCLAAHDAADFPWPLRERRRR